VKVGLYLDLRNPDPWRRPWAEHQAIALELCEEADAKGADSIWFSEHHGFEDGYLPQPLTFAAAAASRTRRARLGTAVMLAPLRPAAQIAEEAAIVDTISDGRLDLGLGAGYRVPEFELFGALSDRPLERLFERIGEVRHLLDEGIVTPGPVQDPFQIWAGCNGPRGARRAGALGLRLLSVHPTAVAGYREGLEAAGLAVEDYPTSGPVGLFVSDDPDRDWPLVSPYLAYQWDSYARAGVEGTDRPAPPPVDVELARRQGLGGGLRGCLIATPEEAVAQLRDRFEPGTVDTIFTWSWLPGVPAEIVARHIELLIDEVAPALAEEV
jgi:alkanesulfonate monooxygenase SsuD/methylene tetrahydromethanopterin reductase-like flavin-dependent oxidoreductase (luciferase family)